MTPNPSQQPKSNAPNQSTPSQPGRDRGPGDPPRHDSEDPKRHDHGSEPRNLDIEDENDDPVGDRRNPG